MDGNLRVFLEAKAKEYAGPVRALSDIASVYQGEHDIYIERICQDAYNTAKAAAMKWLYFVLLMEMAETSADSAKVELTVPCGGMEGRIYVNAIPLENIGIFDTALNDCSGLSPELFYFNFGKMSRIAYEMVTTIKDNPIALLYRYFDSQLALLHDWCGEGLLTAAVLCEHQVHDILDIHRMEILFRDMKSMFQW